MESGFLARWSRVKLLRPNSYYYLQLDKSVSHYVSVYLCVVIF